MSFDIDGIVDMTRRGLVAAAVIVASLSCSAAPGSTGSSAAPSDPAASTDVATASALPLPTPRTTPPGTPAPVPEEPIASSASIDVPSPPPQATPTPTPQPGLWRIGGYVVDEDGAPLGGVCVVVGPLGCKPFSPHTDDRGHWFLDIAEGYTTFDFYFEMPGHKTVWWHTTPTGPTEFNVVLAKG